MSKATKSIPIEDIQAALRGSLFSHNVKEGTKKAKEIDFDFLEGINFAGESFLPVAARMLNSSGSSVLSFKPSPSSNPCSVLRFSVL